MAKKYLSLDRLTEYDELIKGVVSDGDNATLASAKSYADGLANGKADKTHDHNDVYYTETEIDTKLSEVNTSITNITSGTIVVKKAEEANHATSADTATNATNAEHAASADTAVQADKATKADEATHATSADNATEANHAVNADKATNADNATNATNATKATQDASGNVITTTYETKADASAKLAEAKGYADTAATTAANKVKDDLLNGAGEAYDTLKELGDLITENKDAIDVLEDVAGGKADKEHEHTVADITDYVAPVQADWNQNDPEALDYVKNRPFYVGVGSNVELLEETTVNVNEDDLYAYIPHISLKEGQSYTVVFNGETYECVAWYSEDNACPMIGNGNIYGGENMGEDVPFSIDSYDMDSETFLNTNDAGDYTISISTVDSKVVQLDEKFIPYVAGRKTEGGSYTYSYPFSDESVEFSSSLGGEIFNDYKNNIALNNGHAEGNETVAVGEAAHAEGRWAVASGDVSHAEGVRTSATGFASHVEGSGTTAAGDYQHVQGTNNIPDENGRYLHIVGNGNPQYLDEFSNAHTLDWDGNAWFAGDVYVGGESQDDANKLMTEADMSWNKLQDKPFGESVVENVIIPETNFNGTQYSFNTDIESFVVGETYTVIFDGEVYPDLVCGNYNGVPAIGRISQETSNLTFMIGIRNYSASALSMTSGDHSISVIKTEQYVKTIDPKYLPETDMSGYETKEDAQAKLDEAKAYTNTMTSGMATTTVVDNKISTHNTSSTAHSDIRDLITALSTKVNNFLDVSDTTTDQLSEVLTLINNNKGTLDSITSNKVNVSDIVDNLTTANASKVLSANQGVVLKGLIDALQEAVDGKSAEGHKHAISDVTDLQTTLNAKAEQTDLDAVEAKANNANTSITNIVNGTTTVAKATNADSAANAEKLGGQLPSYYAKASDIPTGALANKNIVSESDLDNALAEKVNAAAEGNHSHSNKTILDGITATKVSNWDNAEANAKAYADEKVANLLNNSTEAVDSIMELAEAMENNADAIEALETIAASKVPTSRKVNGKDLTADITLSADDVNADAKGSAGAVQTNLDTHIADSVKHITSTERTNWGKAYTHSTEAHAPSSAQENVIESIKVNGTAQTITSKSVNITVPTDNSQLDNGAGYITASAIANKADKATTLSGYGITDAYTKSEVDAKTAVDSALSATSTKPVQNKVVNDVIVTVTEAITSNTSSINTHSEQISALQTVVADIQEITSAEIQALFEA